jgi:hypothetical protein
VASVLGLAGLGPEGTGAGVCSPLRGAEELEPMSLTCRGCGAAKNPQPSTPTPQQLPKLLFLKFTSNNYYYTFLILLIVCVEYYR